MMYIQSEIDELLHSKSPTELNALFTGKPIEFNWEEGERSFDNDDQQELAQLDFDAVQLILNNPEKAAFGDIILYCEKLKIDPYSFLQTFLDKKHGLVHV